MLSMQALEWLNSVDYSNKSHEERMALIKAAKIAYPPTEAEILAEQMMDIIFGQEGS